VRWPIPLGMSMAVVGRRSNHLSAIQFCAKLCRWFLQDRMRQLYHRLRIVEDASQPELTAPQVVSLQTELENIDRAARILPQRRSDLFFILEQHIILTRTQLASRLVELRRQKTKVV
jgi:hypothetical protein